MIRFFKSTGIVITLVSSFAMTGCDAIFNSIFSSIAEKNLEIIGKQQVLSSNKIAADISISRDEFGLPLIEGQSLNDLAFGMGYMMAQDRLAQMVPMNLLAQGRLSEMSGDLVLDMDIYMRSLNLKNIMMEKYKSVSPEMKSHLESFANGVNHYMEQHKDALPLEFVLNDYQPEPWQAVNTMYMFAVLNLGVGFNLHEELAFLRFAEGFGWEKAAYLVPTYPDEDLDFAEAAKLKGIDLSSLNKELEVFANTQEKLRAINGSGIAASNNWGIHKSKTKNGSTIIANDTHLLLTQPATWMMMHVKSPEYSGVGIALSGVPALVAGYNGHIAWGETMVMADSQDLFLEQLKEIDGKTHYLFKDEWLPVAEREELFKVKGSDDVTITVKSTGHGPIINDALAATPKHVMMPRKASTRYGLALSSTAVSPDETVKSFFALGNARSMEEAKAAIEGVGFIHLNIIYGDKDNVAWQVTGLYPDRKKGTGHFPSLGWTGEYDWQGIIGGSQLPIITNPENGFVSTGNHKTVGAGTQYGEYESTLTNSWYYPERNERIQQMLVERQPHTAQTVIDMQADRVDILLAKVQNIWRGEFKLPLQAEIDRLSKEQKNAAAKALARLLEFDGDMQSSSSDAAVWGVFEANLIRAVFADDLKRNENSALWKSLMDINGRAYSAYQDHLLGRDDSPFWDNILTEEKETKASVIAAALASTWLELESSLGADESKWQWGSLLNYHWQNDATKMIPFLDPVKGYVVDKLGKYTDIGPFPAGGTRNTVNVAGHDTGDAYDVWNVPAMRLVVDFSLDEPVYLTIAGGQSANPESPYYEKGVDTWMKAENRNLPYNSQEAMGKAFKLETQINASH